MNLFKRFFSSKKPLVRKFNAANVNRLSSDWLKSKIHINQDLKSDSSSLKVRCREAAKNDAHMRKYLRMRQINIVGEAGIQLNVRVKDIGTNQVDTIASDLIESKYNDFSKAQFFTVDGKMSRRDVENLLVSSLAYDGEFFCRKVRGFNNKYNFSLQVLDPMNFDLLSNNEKLSNGNYVINGVEIDKYGKPVNYYYLESRQDSYNTYQNKIKIPAEDIIHVFFTEFTGQTRGIPLATSGITKLNDLAGYTEAEIIAARIAASKMGFYITPQGDEVIGQTDTKDVDNKTVLTEVSPGTFESLPEGWDFKGFDPQHPTGNYSQFVKTILREIANGWNVSYNELANDLEGVNYSSIRQGVLFERDCWKNEQQFIIDHFETVIFNEWLRINLMNGQLSPLPYAKLNKFENCDTWQGKRWTWVDPQKDAATNEIMVANGWKTNDQVTAEQGGDYYDNVQQIAKEKQIQEDAGVKLGIESVTNNPPDPDDNEDVENNKPVDKKE